MSREWPKVQVVQPTHDSLIVEHQVTRYRFSLIMATLTLNVFRVILYGFLFIFSIALLVLTAYHIHFTESLSNDFYVPIIVELLVTSCLSVICSSIAFLSIACGGPCPYWVELLSLGIIWIMNLVGAVLITRRWPGPDLTWCLGVLGVCRLIDAIVSYAWINWVLVNFLFALSFICSLGMGKLDLTGPAHKPGNPFMHSAPSRRNEHVPVSEAAPSTGATTTTTPGPPTTTSGPPTMTPGPSSSV